MTAPRKTDRWPVPGLGLVVGAALALLLAVLLDWPLALATAVGAGLGLVGGAVVAARRAPGARS